MPLQPDTVQLFDGALRFCMCGDMSVSLLNRRVIPLLARPDAVDAKAVIWRIIRQLSHERNANRRRLRRVKNG